MINGKNVKQIIVTDPTNEYVLGRISGILRCLGGSRKDNVGFAQFSKRGSGYRVLQVKTTDEKFEKARKIIEHDYPGLCIFNLVLN